MTQEFYHYFVSLLSIMKMKSSQTARHLTSVWETILAERLGTSTVPEEYRKIITLSKQTVSVVRVLVHGLTQLSLMDFALLHCTVFRFLLKLGICSWCLGQSLHTFPTYEYLISKNAELFKVWTFNTSGYFPYMCVCTQKSLTQESNSVQKNLILTSMLCFLNWMYDLGFLHGQILLVHMCGKTWKLGTPLPFSLPDLTTFCCLCMLLLTKCFSWCFCHVLIVK